MDVEARVFLQPLFHLEVLVRRIVVADQMQLFAFGRLALNLAQEVEPFNMAVALRATGNHRTIERTHGGKQRGGPMALVVMGHRFRSAFLERQSGLRAIERLHLTLLVAAQHQGVFWRRHVQAHDIFKFLDELGVTRYLVGLDQVRFEAAGTPHLEHRGVRDAQRGCQLARAPVGRARRCGLCRYPNDFCSVNAWLAATARQIALNGNETTSGKSISPATCLNPPNPQFARNLAVAQSIGCQQDNSCPSYGPHVQRLQSHAAFQFARVRQFGAKNADF